MKLYTKIVLLPVGVVLLYLHFWALSQISLQEYKKHSHKLIDSVDLMKMHNLTNYKENLTVTQEPFLKYPKEFHLSEPTSKTYLQIYTLNKHKIKGDKLSEVKKDSEPTELVRIDSNPLILNEHMCTNRTPKLIILVPSVPSHTRERMAIRDTYAKLSRDRIHQVNGVEIPFVVGIMFLLGGGGMTYVDENVKQENHKYNDIVQFDFKDSYYNLTLKILHGFKWINKYCNNATYVLKADEDVFVNVAALLKQLEKHSAMPNGAVFGHIYSGGKVWRSGQWAIDIKVYDKDVFPRYASGTAYTLTVNLLPGVLKVAESMPYVSVEDAYITGMIASKELGANLVMLKGSSHLGEPSLKPCAFVENERVTKTNLKAKQMYNFWNALMFYEKECIVN